MKSKLKAIGKAALTFAASPQARRYEIPLAIGLYQPLIEVIKHG